MPKLGIARGNSIEVARNVLAGEQQLAITIVTRQEPLQQVQPEGIAKFAPSFLVIDLQEPFQGVDLHSARIAVQAIEDVADQVSRVFLIF